MILQGKEFKLFHSRTYVEGNRFIDKSNRMTCEEMINMHHQLEQKLNDLNANFNTHFFEMISFYEQEGVEITRIQLGYAWYHSALNVSGTNLLELIQMQSGHNNLYSPQFIEYLKKYLLSQDTTQYTAPSSRLFPANEKHIEPLKTVLETLEKEIAIPDQLDFQKELKIKKMAFLHMLIYELQQNRNSAATPGILFQNAVKNFIENYHDFSIVIQGRNSRTKQVLINLVGGKDNFNKLKTEVLDAR